MLQFESEIPDKKNLWKSQSKSLLFIEHLTRLQLQLDRLENRRFLSNIFPGQSWLLLSVLQLYRNKYMPQYPFSHLQNDKVS